MNERIRELAEQAGLELSTVLKDYVTPVKSITIEQRKFAELIVQECITVINQPNGVGDDDVIRITKDVEKHFGVKE